MSANLKGRSVKRNAKTIIGRMRVYLDEYMDQEYIGVNYEDDAIRAYRYIYQNDKKEYADPDYYSPLLYKTWGELLKKKDVIESYRISIKGYRYVLEAEYCCKKERKHIMLGSDGLQSVGNCIGNIKAHKEIGGFALWPSHQGGINFRKNRFGDDIFQTLNDIETFYVDPGHYKGVIPEEDYDWFRYLDMKGGFMNIFFFEGFRGDEDLLAYENERTEQIIRFLHMAKD